jgi:hypothetical protein
VKRKKINQALGMFNDLKINNFNLTDEIFNIIIPGCLESNRIEIATDIITESLRNGYSLKSELYDNVAGKLAMSNSIKLKHKISYATDFLDELNKNKIIIDQIYYINLRKLIKHH